MQLLWFITLFAVDVTTLFTLQGQIYELNAEVSATKADLYSLLLLAGAGKVMNHSMETMNGVQCTLAALLVTVMAEKLMTSTKPRSEEGRTQIRPDKSRT